MEDSWGVVEGGREVSLRVLLVNHGSASDCELERNSAGCELK